MSQSFPKRIAMFVLLLPIGIGHASDNEAPMERITATADRLELDQQTGVQTLSGNVVITHGDISIRGNLVRVTMINGAISRIFGAGQPIKFQQKLVEGEIVQTESDEIDYLTSAWKLVFRGNVVLRRGNWQLEGHRVEYNTRNRNFHAVGFRQIETQPKSEDSRVSITYNR